MGIFFRTEDPAEPRRARRRPVCRPGMLFRTMLALLLVAAVVVLVPIISDLNRNAGPPKIPVMELRNIGELATQAGYFTVVQNIDLSRKPLGFTVPGSEDTYVFSYDGVVKAGMDFGEIAIETDSEGRRILITLPEVRILSVELDESSFRQYSGGGNLLSKLTPEQANQGREEAKKKALENAIENGIMEAARENAEALITHFVAGYSDTGTYEIVYQEPKTTEEKTE